MAQAPGVGVCVPLASASASSPVPAVSPADWQVFRAFCETFLRQDDPYLEVDQLGDLAEEQGWNERKLSACLEDFARLGWLRLGRPTSGRIGFGGRQAGEGITLAEITFAGLDVYCRHAGGIDYPALVREVASCLVHDRPDTGAKLRSALLSARARMASVVPGLLLAHVVEALANMGMLETCQQWAGPLGFQIGPVAPELQRWVNHDTPLLAAAA